MDTLCTGGSNSSNYVRSHFGSRLGQVVICLNMATWDLFLPSVDIKPPDSEVMEEAKVAFERLKLPEPSSAEGMPESAVDALAVSVPAKAFMKRTLRSIEAVEAARRAARTTAMVAPPSQRPPQMAGRTQAGLLLLRLHQGPQPRGPYPHLGTISPKGLTLPSIPPLAPAQGTPRAQPKSSQSWRSPSAPPTSCSRSPVLGP